MTTLSYSQLNTKQQEQVNQLIAEMEGKQENTVPAVRFVARGAFSNGELGGRN